MSNNSLVCVLLLNYNGKHLLKDSLSSYLANDYPNFEIVLIDNGSVDGSQEYVRTQFPQVHLIENGKNLGYSGGFNAGLEYTFQIRNAKYALVSNNDIKADRKVISELVTVAESDPTIGFVTGKVFYFDNPTVFQTVGKREDPIRWNGSHIGQGEHDQGQYDQICERIFADDIFTLVKGAMYRELGGYDTTFFLQCEEYDWQARAKLAGYKIMYTPYAKIWHKESATLGKASAKKMYYDARNPLIVIMRYKSTLFFRRFMWHHLYDFVIKASLVNLKRLQPKISYKIWQGFFSGLIWGTRNRILSVRHFI
ncbi:MAG: glycosyltransferase family 2 protein [Bacteroidota bacterium]